MTRMTLALLAFLTPTLNAQSVPRPESFSLNDLADIPRASGPSAAPAGGLVAWVENHQGRRNLFVAGPPEYRPMQLTRYTTDDGIVISNIRFSPDGTWLVYTRGGSTNNRGERHNPQNLPDPVERTLWRISVTGGEPAKLGTGGFGSLRFFPDGKRLIYSQGREIRSMPFEPPFEPERLFTIRGSAGSLTFSADGSKLAFTSNRAMYGRGGYGFVGVYDLADRTITYLFPNVEYDVAPVWSPDGRRVAFIRNPRLPKSYRFSDRSDVVPWSIVVADAASGRGEVVWSADSGQGSYIGFGRDLLWTRDNRLVFTWEKTGWNLLYSVPADGGQATLLTPGEFEVFELGISQDRSTILFSSNQDDIERRHIWRLSIDDWTPRQLTRGDGVEGDAVVLSDGNSIAYAVRRYNTPPHVVVLQDMQREIALGPNVDPSRPPYADFVKPEIVSFSEPNGTRIYAHLYRAQGQTRERAHPVLVYAHGGCHSKSYPAFGNALVDGVIQYVVSRGYYGFTVNFRSGTGRGLAFREPPNYGGRGAEEIADFVAAAEYLKSIPEVNPNAIAILGWSCGGHIVTNTLARHSNLYAAGISYAGVGDWRVEMEMDAGRRMPFRVSRRMTMEDLAYESSGIAHIDKWKSPVLFIHGDDDRRAAMWPTIEMTLELRRRHVPAETLILPGEAHSFLLHATRQRILHRVYEFLENYLNLEKVSEPAPGRGPHLPRLER